MAGSAGNDDDEVAFFQCGGLVVALWDRAALAEDSAVEDTGGWGGVTLALNVRSPDEVDEVLDQAAAAGAVIGRAGCRDVLGRLLRGLRRPRRPPVGGRPQPVLDRHRRRGETLLRAADAAPSRIPGRRRAEWDGQVRAHHDHLPATWVRPAASDHGSRHRLGVAACSGASSSVPSHACGMPKASTSSCACGRSAAHRSLTAAVTCLLRAGVSRPCSRNQPLSASMLLSAYRSQTRSSSVCAAAASAQRVDRRDERLEHDPVDVGPGRRDDVVLGVVEDREQVGAGLAGLAQPQGQGLEQVLLAVLEQVAAASRGRSGPSRCRGRVRRR